LNDAVLCPRETSVLVDSLKNTGNTAKTVTLITQGSAASWTATVPQGITLAPGEERAIYTYVTPLSNTPPGSYPFEIMITGDGELKRIPHTIIVKNCFDVNIQSPDVVKEVCPRQVTHYELEFTNTGAYQEDFILRADGLLKDVVTLTENVLTLKQGERKQVDAYLVAPADAGEYGFSVAAQGKSGKSIQTISALLKVNPCYQFDVRQTKQVMSMCEKTTQTIPVLIENKGTVTNKYTLKINGPAWAHADTESFTLASGTQATANVLLDPGYGIKGDENIMLEVSPERGDQKAVTTLHVNVRQCHGVAVHIDQKEARTCTDNVARSVPVTIQNTGEGTKQYALKKTGPGWVTMHSPDTLTLKPGEKKELTLTLQVSQDIAPKTYPVTVSATATDESGVTAKDHAAVDVQVDNAATCYAPALTVPYNDLVIFNDASVTLPVHIQNSGRETAVYQILVTGAAAAFTKLNPAVLTVHPGSTETAYMYIAPGPQTALAQYDVDIGVKLDKGDILTSKKITMRVTDKPEEATRLETSVRPVTQTAWERFKNWIYARVVPQKQETAQQPEKKNTQEPTVVAKIPVTISWSGIKEKGYAYRYYLLSAIILLLFIILGSRFGVWGKAVDFFLEEDEAEDGKRDESGAVKKTRKKSVKKTEEFDTIKENI